MSKFSQHIEICKFFIGVNGRQIDNEYLQNVKLHEIKLPQRFLNIIRYYNDNISEINNLNDLLNINYYDFLVLKNCGYNTINDVRSIILKYVHGITKKYKLEDNYKETDDKVIKKISSIDEQLKETIFFKGSKGTKLESDYLKSVPVSYIDFAIRFQHVLNNLKTIKCLNDLLNTDYVNFLLRPNIAEKTVNDAREKILLYLKNVNNNESPIKNDTNFIEDIIGENINSYFKKKSPLTQRNTEMFFMYMSGQVSLEYLGEKFNITRERVRQIIDTIIRVIKKNLNEYLFIVREMNSYGLFFKINNFIDYLMANNLLRIENKDFLNNFIKEFFIGKVIFEEFGYIITISSDTLEPSLRKINESVVIILTNLEEGLKLNELILELRNAVSDNTFIEDSPVDENLIGYLAVKFKDFYMIDSVVYNKMMYNIVFGCKLPDVFYWSLKYLREPIHFTQLAQFIREKNINFKNIQDINVHSGLMRFEFCHDVDRGTYALKELNIPKHVSAGEAIIDLLKCKGPLLESEIKEKLRKDYSPWNITLALSNNMNKLTKIGNNLYDIKREI